MNDLRPWLEFRFDRAEGPGGQNVNKLNTRATLLFDFEGCARLTPDERTRLRARLTSRLAADGRLRVVSQRQRSQLANRVAAEERLLELLQAALQTPKRRRPTRPTAAAQARRVQAKRLRSHTKRLRRQQADATD